MFWKGYPLEAKNALKNWNQSVHIFWARLTSLGHLKPVLSGHSRIDKTKVLKTYGSLM